MKNSAHKIVVHYLTNKEVIIMLGCRAWVWPVDHISPKVSNSTYVSTSPVIRIGENGEFETENSIYRPIGDS